MRMILWAILLLLLALLLVLFLLADVRVALPVDKLGLLFSMQVPEWWHLTTILVWAVVVAIFATEKHKERANAAVPVFLLLFWLLIEVIILYQANTEKMLRFLK
jgi:hypothetical protein